MHAFSVWLRTGSNPADSNRFRSHTGKYSNVTKRKALKKFWSALLSKGFLDYQEQLHLKLPDPSRKKVCMGEQSH